MTPSPVLAAFTAGALTTGYAIACVFFASFWARTRDSLFALFAAAFALMAANQALPMLLGVAREDQSPIYLLRLVAFGLIIYGVLRKNLSRRAAPDR